MDILKWLESIGRDPKHVSIESLRLLQQLTDHMMETHAPISEVRQAFADYFKSEGCSCCRNVEEHNKAEFKLAEFLKAEPFDDGSGIDWYKYATP